MNTPNVNPQDTNLENTELGKGSCGTSQPECESTDLNSTPDKTELSTDEKTETSGDRADENTELASASKTNDSAFNQAAEDGKKGKLCWKKVSAGGVAGLALGTTAVLLSTPARAGAPEAYATGSYGELVFDPVDEVDEVAGEETNTSPFASLVDPEVAWAGNVDNEMSFPDAFANARAEVGPGGVFEWRGTLYGTYTADEWDKMSTEERDGFNNHFAWSTDSAVDVEPEINTASEAAFDINVHSESEFAQNEQAPQTEIEVEVSADEATDNLAENVADNVVDNPANNFAANTAQNFAQAETESVPQAEIEGQEQVPSEIDLQVEPALEADVEVEPIVTDDPDHHNEFDIVDNATGGAETNVQVEPVIEIDANNQFEIAHNFLEAEVEVEPIAQVDPVISQAEPQVDIQVEPDIEPEIEVVVENNSEISGNMYANQDAPAGDAATSDFVAQGYASNQPFYDLAESEVEILGVTTDEASGMTFGAVTIDGQEVLLIDVESDGEFDYAAVDTDGDGEIGVNEILDISQLDMADNIVDDLGIDDGQFIDPALDNDDMFLA